MDDNRKLYGELGELTRYIENTMRQLRTAEAPVTETTVQLPQGSEHLSGLAELTEEGTHRVMELTEELQDIAARSQNYWVRYSRIWRMDAEEPIHPIAPRPS